MKIRGAAPEKIGRPAPYATSRPITVSGREEDAVAPAVWHGWTEAEAADIEQTVPLVLAHRIRRRPFQAIAGAPQIAEASW